MMTYEYTARSSAGTALKGCIAADSDAEAARLLRAEGKFVIDLLARAESEETASGGARARRRGGRVRSADVELFASQMAIMLETGVGIGDALDTVIDDCPPGGARWAIEDVRRRVEGGSMLSEAFAHNPRAFDPLFVNLIKASEASGQLPLMFGRISDHLRSSRDIRRRTVGAMIYPGILLCLSILVVVFMLAFLLPKFTVLYKGKEALLPKPTKILMAVSDSMVQHGALWAIGAALLSAALVVSFKRERGRRFWHGLVLKLPVLGAMYRKSILTRSLKTMGTLIESGVSGLEMISITRGIARNHHFEKLWDEVADQLHRGRQLSVPLAASPLVPRSITQMIQAGEKSGQLGKVLEKLGGFLLEDLRQTIERATRLVEPVLIMIMGSVIGAIAISLLLPIFTLSRVVR